MHSWVCNHNNKNNQRPTKRKKKLSVVVHILYARPEEVNGPSARNNVGFFRGNQQKKKQGRCVPSSFFLGGAKTATPFRRKRLPGHRVCSRLDACRRPKRPYFQDGGLKTLHGASLCVLGLLSLHTSTALPFFLFILFTFLRMRGARRRGNERDSPEIRLLSAVFDVACCRASSAPPSSKSESQSESIAGSCTFLSPATSSPLCECVCLFLYATFRRTLALQKVL